jgi:hypothetical protein
MSQYVFSFDTEEIIQIILAHLHELHYQMPHMDKVATAKLTQTNNHWELILDEHYPEDVVPVRPIIQVAKPKEKPNPHLIDTSRMSSEELFGLAALKEEKEQQQRAQGIIPTTDRKPKQEETENLSDKIALLALSKGQEFTISQIYNEMGLTKNTERVRTAYVLASLAKSGSLKKKKVPHPTRKNTFQWLFANRENK